MLRFCANISTMFTELPLLDRFAAAAEAGFSAVEMQTPYEADAEDLARARDKANVDFVLLSFHSGSREHGDCGLGALPDRVDELRKTFDLTRRYAERLHARCLNLLAGCPGPDVEPARAHESLVENFRRAARAMSDLGAVVILEPINSHDVPGFFVSTVDEAVAILDDVGEPNIGLQFDVYHVERMGEVPVPTFEHSLRRIAHVQFSDSPGRQEPGTGRIDFPSVFAAIERSDYRGWTGAEYFPKRPTPETLDWFEPYRRR